MGKKGNKSRKGSEQEKTFSSLISLVPIALVFAGVAIYSAWTNRHSTIEPPTTSSTSSSQGFTSRTSLTEHFRKHGHEFGVTTESEYEALAIRLRDRPKDSTILEGTRNDRVTTRLDKAGGGFVAYNPNRSIRTFFKPNNGESYFYRQLNR